MTKYEFTFLLFEESELKNIKDLLKSLTGKITSEESWGERSLYYPIKGHSKALFFHWLIELSAEKTKEFKTKLGFNNKIIRYLLLNSEL